jgi:hypothetical protein
MAMTARRERRADLDVVRAGIVFGLIVYHTARVFDFYVKGPESSRRPYWSSRVPSGASRCSSSGGDRGWRTRSSGGSTDAFIRERVQEARLRDSFTRS